MDLVNSLSSTIFNVLLAPLTLVGPRFAMIVVSGIFGVLALLAFKHISWQKGIKATKDKIKGNMIAIRLYQDDLVVVARAVGRVLLRNFQYLGLNFGPFIPLAIPFVLVAAQLVVRFGFAPIPVEEPRADFLPGQGTMLEIRMAAGHEAEAAGVQVHLPEGLYSDRPLHRSAIEGVVYQEFVAVESGEWEIGIELADGTVITKQVATGEAAPAMMQPERTASFWGAWLWPAEDTLAGTSLARISFVYPDSDLGWMGGGPLWVLIILIVASMAFGFATLKPLGVTI